MKKALILILLAIIFYNVSAQQVLKVTDTIVAGSIENSCPGGFTAFNLYIKKNVRPPAVAFEDKKVGTTYVSFIVEPDGTVSHVLTILSIGSGMDEEAIRVIKMSKNWIPATIDGKPVRSFCRVGVQFLADFDNNSMWVVARKLD